jgi:hypothetical protein
VLDLFEQPLPPRVSEHVGDLVARARFGELILLLDAEHAEQEARRDGERPHDRTEERREPAHRQGEQQRGAVGRAHGQVLRHHLAEHEVEEHHERQRHDEGDRVSGTTRQTDVLHRPLQDLGQRRLRQEAEQDRAERDAQLRRREHERQLADGLRSCSCTRIAFSRHALELRLPRRDERELGGHEEAVADEEDEGSDDGEDHGAVTRTCAIRRRSISVISNVQPS